MLLKSVHITAVCCSGLLFVFRGIRVLFGYTNNGFMLKVLPHIIDTILLISAVMLAYRLHQYPFINSWLTAKVMGLLLYIVLAHYCLKKAKGFFSRLLFFVLALTTFLYIVGAAHWHTPLSWWGHI